ncbi:hypothetical protein C922_05379 [Plasmodium inui San Antonio 1]|uniref:Uncharacterized protein n=1 Tax=Plasmodium inui San Antonio 1 TaxID=1237626 RepID=W6ZY60_9APIC|nr:hypothetical protein C922_05379 [Plasmodium inui San Antonio 1]EUD64248.1 hypothetical protein C922_05379 [Plasmodium inui San Antonio 1]
MIINNMLFTVTIIFFKALSRLTYCKHKYVILNVKVMTTLDKYYTTFAERIKEETLDRLLGKRRNVVSDNNHFDAYVASSKYYHGLDT